jgi:hypothetical protein
VVGVGVRDHHEPYVLHAQMHLFHRPLELRDRSWLVHPGIDQDHAGPGRDRPRVAVRHPRERQRQPQPPEPGEDALPATQLASRGHAPHDIRRA